VQRSPAESDFPRVYFDPLPAVWPFDSWRARYAIRQIKFHRKSQTQSKAGLIIPNANARGVTPDVIPKRGESRE